MGPVGGLVSAWGAKPEDLAGTLGLKAAPYCPKCDPSLSQWSFSQRMNMISLDLPNCKSFLFYLRVLHLGLLSHLRQNQRPSMQFEEE